MIGAILGNLVACSMAAYAFARLEFRAKRVWFAVMLITIMLPIHVIIVREDQVRCCVAYLRASVKRDPDTPALVGLVRELVA